MTRSAAIPGHLSTVLTNAGSSLADVVEATVFVTDITRQDVLAKLVASFSGTTSPGTGCGHAPPGGLPWSTSSGLAPALSEADPVVRATALIFLRALRLGDVELFADLLPDSDIAVRSRPCERSCRSTPPESRHRAAAVEPSREVRVTIAKALATAGSVPGHGPLGPRGTRGRSRRPGPSGRLRGTGHGRLTGRPGHPRRGGPDRPGLAGARRRRHRPVRHGSRPRRPRTRQGPRRR